MSKNKGMVIVSKEVAYWTNIVKNLKNAIDIDEKALRWNKLCLDMAEKQLKQAEISDNFRKE